MLLAPSVGIFNAEKPMAENLNNQLIEPLYYSSATSLCKAIRQKTFSSEEIVRIFLNRIEVLNPKINAVVVVAADEAIKAAKAADKALASGEALGPLHGLPITLKDTIDTAGMVSTAGTLGRNKFIPHKDATVAARLRASGAILLGKTNTPELTLSNDTNNLIYGRTYNPYDCIRSPGGSSGGAAAALASGATALDIGSDTGGSIRYPAHCCGIVGIKPTSGRVSRTGHAIPFGGLIDSFTQLGPMARYVDDLILSLPVIVGADWKDPSVIPMPLGDPRDVKLDELRVSFHTDNGIKKPTKEVADTIRRAALILDKSCAVVEESRPDGIEQTEEIYRGLFNADGGAKIRKLLIEAGTTTPGEKWIKQLKPTSMTKYIKLLDKWDSFRKKMTSFLKSYDVIISPVNTSPALEPAKLSGWAPMFSYARTYNLTGWPCVVVRGGTSTDGLPIGIQIISHPWREDVALAVAKHLEATMVGFQPPPEEAMVLDHPDANPADTRKHVVRMTSSSGDYALRIWRTILSRRKR